MSYVCMFACAIGPDVRHTHLSRDRQIENFKVVTGRAQSAI